MSKKIVLKPAPAITPRGKQRGTFVEIKQESGTNASGQEFNKIILVVQLEAKDPGGKNYQVQREYNLLGRGFAAFSSDFESWAGRTLKQSEIEGFDPDALIKGQKVIAEIVHRTVGKDMSAVIKAFYPANDAEAVAD